MITCHSEVNQPVETSVVDKYNFPRPARFSLLAWIVGGSSPFFLRMLVMTRGSPRPRLKTVLDDLEFGGFAPRTTCFMMIGFIHEWIDFVRESGRKAVMNGKKALAE